jgi:hypothetical protein
MSLVLAADYRVPDFDHWWATLTGDLPRLPSLGAHHIVVYRSLEDASRIFVTIGVRERSPAAAGGKVSPAAAGGKVGMVDALLRSPVMFSWFDSAGVEEIPPMFAGEVVEKLELAEQAAPPAATGAVIVAAIAPVGRLQGVDRLRASVHAAVARLAASGVRRFWIYRALDDQAEVMILQEFATERQAEQWIRHPDAAAAFMAEAGAGAYPPLFVGRLVQAIEVPGN